MDKWMDRWIEMSHQRTLHLTNFPLLFRMRPYARTCMYPVKQINIRGRDIYLRSANPNAGLRHRVDSFFLSITAVRPSKTRQDEQKTDTITPADRTPREMKPNAAASSPPSSSSSSPLARPIAPLAITSIESPPPNQ